MRRWPENKITLHILFIRYCRSNNNISGLILSPAH